MYRDKTNTLAGQTGRQVDLTSNDYIHKTLTRVMQHKKIIHAKRFSNASSF